MKYSIVLDPRIVKKPDFVALRLDILAQINSTKLDARLLEKQGIEYRHILDAPTFNYMRRAEPLTVGVVNFGGWFAITNLILRHVATQDNAPNADGGSFPILDFHASLGFVGADRVLGAPTKLCIGVSSDDGVTWTPLDGAGGTLRTQRFLGDGSGYALPNYATPSQPHYLTGAPGYRPINYPSERMVDLVAAFGGDYGSHGAPSGINAYTVMVDGDVSDDCQGWGYTKLDAREDGY